MYSQFPCLAPCCHDPLPHYGLSPWNLKPKRTLSPTSCFSPRCFIPATKSNKHICSAYPQPTVIEDELISPVTSCVCAPHEVHEQGHVPKERSSVLPASGCGSESTVRQLLSLLPSKAVYPWNQHSVPGPWPCVVPLAHGAQCGSFPWAGSIVSWLPELMSDHLLSALLMAWNPDHFSVASLQLGQA